MGTAAVSKASTDDARLGLKPMKRLPSTCIERSISEVADGYATRCIQVVHFEQFFDDRTFPARVESADTLVGQKSAFIKHKSVCNPVVNIEHTRNGTHEHIHTCADNGHENAFLLQTSDDFSGTRHQLNTGVRSKDLVLVDGVLHGFPHLNVRAHELNVADLTPDKPIQVQTVVRTKGIVEVRQELTASTKTPSQSNTTTSGRFATSVMGLPG